MRRFGVLVLSLFVSLITYAEDSSSNQNYEELKKYKAEAVNLNTGERFAVGGIRSWQPGYNASKSKTKAEAAALTMCVGEGKKVKEDYQTNFWMVAETNSNDWKKITNCIIFKSNDEVVYKNIKDYYAKKAVKDKNNKRKVANSMKSFETTKSKLQELPKNYYDHYLPYISRCQDLSIESADIDFLMCDSYISSVESGIKDEYEKISRNKINTAANLESYKKACKDYGFTTKRDIATCVQQETRFAKQDAVLMAQNREIEELRAEIMKVPEKSNKEFLLELLEPHRRMEEIKNQRQRDADIQAIKRALYR